jgi:hypothetical protein
MRWAATLLVILLALAGFIWLLAFPRPPAGYHWPQHTLWGEGPTAGVTGVLLERGGCIYLGSETGDEIGLLVWPMFATLAEKDDELVVRIDGRTVAIGDMIRGGGGYYETNELPDSMAAARAVPCGGPPYILFTGLADSP